MSVQDPYEALQPREHEELWEERDLFTHKDCGGLIVLNQIMWKCRTCGARGLIWTDNRLRRIARGT